MSSPGQMAALAGRPLWRLLGLTGTLLLAACANSHTPPPAPALSGTTWQLVAIQSMDDAQGTTTIAEPQRFTLHFGADGLAVFLLDCNRGTGPWKQSPAAADSGSLTFGPLASTRALCPPPRLDERLVRDLPHVRGYLLREGMLHLSLQADGGIYSWKPLESHKE